MITEEQRRTKDLLNNLLPQLPSNGPTEFNKWLEFITSFIKNEIKEAAAATSAITHSNNHNNSRVNNSKDITSVNGNEESNSSSSSASGGDINNSCEVLLLQNAQLQKSLDEYKSIVADTVSSLFFSFILWVISVCI